jgi:hypothetical protein
MTQDDLVAFLGEGFHTAFRKAGESAAADQIWRLIGSMDPDEWQRIVEFVAVPLAEELGRA